MVNRVGVWVIAAALSATSGSVAWGHHSYAMFDMHKIVELKGTVKEFHYTNPHCWIVLSVRDASGMISDAVIEANGPGYLVRFGWKRASLAPGDAVVASINPLRDGSAGGSLLKLTFADGHELNAKPELPPEATAP